MPNIAAPLGPVIHLSRSASWVTQDAADAVLDAPARARHDRLLLLADREDFVAARVLAREAIAQIAGCAVDSVLIGQRCGGCGRQGHGRPVVIRPQSVHVSWSHARGLVAVIAARHRVGIDIERVQHIDHGVAEFALGPGEGEVMVSGGTSDEDIIGRWTRKEALVKVGAIRLDDFPNVNLGPSADGWDGWLLSGRPVVPAHAMVAVASEGTGSHHEDHIRRAAAHAALSLAVATFSSVHPSTMTTRARLP